MIEEAKPTALHFGERRVVFRSRLEARWARYFDQMNLSWLYEPFSEDIGSGVTYTPDFVVEGIGAIEIKPTIEALDESAWRIEKFCAKNAKRRVYLFHGSNPYSAGTTLLTGRPLKAIAMTGMQRVLVLAGAGNQPKALEDFNSLRDQVYSFLDGASNPHFGTDPLSVAEIMELADNRPSQSNSGHWPVVRKIARMVAQAHNQPA